MTEGRRYIQLVIMIALVGIIAAGLWGFTGNESSGGAVDLAATSAAKSSPDPALGKSELMLKSSARDEPIGDDLGWVDSDPVHALDRVSRMSRIYSHIYELAQEGNVSAMAALFTHDQRCARFSFDNAPPPAPSFADEDGRVQGSEIAAKQAAWKEIVSYCDVPIVPGQDINRFFAQLEAAAANGNPDALAFKGFDDDVSESELLEVLLATDNPRLAKRALYAFARSDGPVSREVTQEVFGGSDWLGSDAIQRIKARAAEWSACDRGGLCGVGIYERAERCMKWGLCEDGSDSRALIRNHYLSPVEFSLMQRYLDAVSAHLQEH